MIAIEKAGGVLMSEANEASATSDVERVVMRLRGQLQNCVNHLELLKRHAYRSDEEKIDACIESANKALYETLGA